jgi:hypothetical protein
MDPIGDVHMPLKAARPFSRRQLPYAMRLSHGSVLSGLLTTLGLLAFFFSVVSPYDDDVQQEFVQSKKPKQYVVLNCKADCAVHTSGKNEVQHAVLPQRILIFCCGVIRHALVPDEEILGTIPSGGTGDRSPPARSS